MQTSTKNLHTQTHTQETEIIIIIFELLPSQTQNIFADAGHEHSKHQTNNIIIILFLLLSRYKYRKSTK